MNTGIGHIAKMKTPPQRMPNTSPTPANEKYPWYGIELAAKVMAFSESRLPVW
jgi:hypothetical protein